MKKMVLNKGVIVDIIIVLEVGSFKIDLVI